jgi:hypothetical protein
MIKVPVLPPNYDHCTICNTDKRHKAYTSRVMEDFPRSFDALDMLFSTTMPSGLWADVVFIYP